MFVTMVLVSCNLKRSKVEKPKISYEYTQITVIPDSNKVKMREWITKTVEAASKNMTGG